MPDTSQPTPQSPSQPQPTSSAATASPTFPRLYSEAQILSALKSEIDQTSLATVAKRTGIQSSQISDVLYGRANLSDRMVKLLKLKLHKFYEKVG